MVLLRASGLCAVFFGGCVDDSHECVASNLVTMCDAMTGLCGFDVVLLWRYDNAIMIKLNQSIVAMIASLNR